MLEILCDCQRAELAGYSPALLLGLLVLSLIALRAAWLLVRP